MKEKWVKTLTSKKVKISGTRPIRIGIGHDALGCQEETTS